jgi:hypothetical protein
LGRELFGQTIDIELTASNSEIDPKRHEHGEDQGNLCECQAPTQGMGRQRCQEIPASWRRARFASGW